ncbi:histidine kinase [Pedobacter sp. Du54]|uniref:sensor histidine kinase n=1 Tax=Pedobacter anseongensis TaxID=3133439 RepID=UPI0030B7A445
MIEKRLSFKEHGWLRTNIKYAIIGIIVGLIISSMIALFSPNGIGLQSVLLNILFSFFITLSIANIIGLVQCYFTPKGHNFWKFVLVYYACNLAGMFIGMELSYLIVSLIFHVEYNLMSHIGDYKFNIFITLVIGTLILLYHFQRVNAEAVLRSKEMDLVKLNQSKTQTELQALQSKINPHFLYNSLNSIVSLIHEDPDKAEEMTLKLSKLFRYSINAQNENFCAIKEEIEILNTYLDIEKVRFGNRIQFMIEVPKELEHEKVPRFLLQPMVENALKHGLKDVRDHGEIQVVVTKNEDQLDLFIYDNGIPFPNELEAGYGMQSTFDKLQLLYKDNYDLQINNSPKKHIKISIPLT